MSDNLEEPLSMTAIAREAGVGMRQLERLFVRHLNWSPARFYMGLRLERARELPTHGNASILDVALGTGFSSSSYLAESYRACYGLNPSAVRREAGSVQMAPATDDAAGAGTIGFRSGRSR